MKRTLLTPHRRTDELYRRLDELCEFAPEAAPHEELVFWFVQLVRWLRGSSRENRGLRVRYLRSKLEKYPSCREHVGCGVSLLLQRCDVARLLAYGGIARDFHFGGAVREWLSFRVLPMACDTNDAASVVSMAFEEGDERWLAESDVGALALSLVESDGRELLRRASEEALVDLGYQLVAQAHSPTLRELSSVERSPFRGMTQAIDEFLAQPVGERRPEALHGRMRQCRLQIVAYAKQLVERGADLNTSFQLDRISQQLHRAALLVLALCGMNAAQVGAACVAIVRSVTRNTSGRRLIARSSTLVLRNLIDTAAAVGQDYLSTERSGWRAAFFAGAGGGVLMALATLLKYQLASWELPTFYEGLFFALNYGVVFCAAYLLHCTIATKLPAHTAAALARTVQQPHTGHVWRIRSFLATWRATVRLQLAGLLGNVMFAGPVAYLVDVLAQRAFGEHVLTGEQAEHVMHANSILGPSAFYAALTGVFLWLSSLAGAAADNWTRVTRLLERLSTNVHVMRFVGTPRARPLAQWWVDHWGGLTGNLSLGFMLGAIPALAAILSLPLEIRHITVSTSSVALAFAARSVDGTQLGLAAAGLLVIAIVNVSVSFALALQVTLASTGRGAHGSAHALVRLAMRHWLRRKHFAKVFANRKLAGPLEPAPPTRAAPL